MTLRVFELVGDEIDPEEAADKIGRTAILQFCQPIIDDTGEIAIARQGAVQYELQSCDLSAMSRATSSCTTQKAT